MPLVDYQIHSLCLQGMIDPFDEGLINPASLDVRVGDSIVVETAAGFVLTDLTRYSEAEPYRIYPGEFLLMSTLETFNMPDTIAGEFRLKSSRAREGFDQALAIWCDPGWNGSKLTLEVRNNCRFHQLPIYPGRLIGQIIFHQCDRPLVSYRQKGRYNNDLVAQMSKG
ncbi:dCTP deaminase [Phormidium sp. FACHB-592]|uniref:dCTP deaminase n=1 Tax=Stenomitos frigidus AS-A4 TaxID=2933935 RepID=A0ABV0KFD6_9CYAN|nr:dCTP deaminase [Phormidium sp. FACHB-592]MBD2076360.1 dCTP deaminase [Phormidium sp. FACHB-592]